MTHAPPIDLATLADGYDECRRTDPADFNRLLDLICRVGRPQGRILEIGCGTGYYLVPLAQRIEPAQAIGFDLAAEMLDQARAKVRAAGLTSVCLLRADGQRPPFRDESFDFVLLSQVLHFFPDPDKAAREIERITAPGGRLVLITTSHRQLRSQTDLALFPGIARRDTARIPDIPVIRAFFEGHAFRLEATHEVAATFHAASAEALVEWAARKPWSSYQLLPEATFRQNLAAFRRNLKKAFGEGEIHYLFPQTLLFFEKRTSA